MLEAEAGLADGKGTIRLVGIDALRAAQIQPALERARKDTDCRGAADPSGQRSGKSLKQ